MRRLASNIFSRRAGQRVLSAPLAAGAKPGRCKPRPGPGNAPIAASKPRTAGTIMHHTKLPLTLWFWAAYLMATHSNGISALQLQRQLGPGSYTSAWLLCAKLRRSMGAGGRNPLAGLVEVDETEIVCRNKDDP